MEEVKYYISSDGTKKEIKSLHTEYLVNALAKKYKSIYESKDQEEYYKNLSAIEDLKEEVYKRMNEFAGNLD